MSRSLTASDRSVLIRLASTLPVGSPERRAILTGLQKAAGGPNTEAEWQEFLDMQERYSPPAVYHQYVREYHAWKKKKETQGRKGSRTAGLPYDQIMRIEEEVDVAFGSETSLEVMDDDSRYDRNGADLVIRISGQDVGRAPQMLRALEHSAFIEKPGSTWDIEDLYDGDFLFRANVKGNAQVPVDAELVLEYVRRLWSNPHINLRKPRKPGLIAEIIHTTTLYVEKVIPGEVDFVVSPGEDRIDASHHPDTYRTEQAINTLFVEFHKNGAIFIQGTTPFGRTISYRSRDGFDQGCKKALGDVFKAWEYAWSRSV